MTDFVLEPNKYIQSPEFSPLFQQGGNLCNQIVSCNLADNGIGGLSLIIDTRGKNSIISGSMVEHSAESILPGLLFDSITIPISPCPKGYYSMTGELLTGYCTNPGFHTEYPMDPAGKNVLLYPYNKSEQVAVPLETFLSEIIEPNVGVQSNAPILEETPTMEPEATASKPADTPMPSELPTQVPTGTPVPADTNVPLATSTRDFSTKTIQPSQPGKVEAHKPINWDVPIVLTFAALTILIAGFSIPRIIKNYRIARSGPVTPVQKTEFVRDANPIVRLNRPGQCVRPFPQAKNAEERPWTPDDKDG